METITSCEVGAMAEFTDRRSDGFTEERPWGRFQSFVTNELVTVKVITVEPGKRLSLQSHRQRAELWQVLDAAQLDVTVGDQTWSAVQGEQIWIPVGTVHRLGNSGTSPARVLEVGFGQFDEDDIIRLEDDFSRS